MILSAKPVESGGWERGYQGLDVDARCDVAVAWRTYGSDIVRVYGNIQELIILCTIGVTEYTKVFNPIS